MTDLSTSLRGMNKIAAEKTGWLDRFRGEMHFVDKYLEAHPNVEWSKLAGDAVAHVTAGISDRHGAKVVVTEAEAMLAPLAAEAKKFTVHCIGHAHIDMLWMWDWPETVACTNDTFSTVDRLMDEYPDFHFSQSQTSVYEILVKYFPELKKKVQQRINEGKWEVVSSQWVEGDKNLASGEILCRHILYSRNYLKKEYGLPYDAVKIDWEPDTFGHGCTHPGILRAGGISRYYFCRGGKGKRLFWWVGKDGSKILSWDVSPLWYNGNFDEDIITEVMKFNKETSLNDYLFVYGVGDHGGGPTRKDLDKAVFMSQWPVYPVIKFSTTDAFFSAVEAANAELPMVEGEMNFVFEGCYTSQTNIKFANRKMECFLPEAEFAAVIGLKKLGFEYPLDEINAGWQRAMFCQFHDILPGSGVRGSYQYAQGLLQETMASTIAIKTRVMRALGNLVNTAPLFAGTEMPERSIGVGVGAGSGDIPATGAATRYSSGGVRDTLLVMNSNPWKRSDILQVRVWDRDWAEDEYLVCLPDGTRIQGQIIERDPVQWGYWGHKFATVAIPAKNVPAGGYAVYGVTRGKDANAIKGTCSGDSNGIMENEFFRLQVEKESGAIIHLIDKKSGKDFVPAGGRLGVLEFMKEAPHGMSAWTIGEIIESKQLTTGGTFKAPNKGPFIAKVVSKHKFGSSDSKLTITLAAGVPRIDFALEVNWLEIGNEKNGVPMLKVSFETGITDGTAKFECANGSVTRPCGALISNMQQADANTAAPAHTDDVPAQKWVDLSAADGTGITLLNDCKYGHSIAGGIMKISLIHSSYEPDPLPDMGKHIINFAIVPHDAAWTEGDATRAGYDVNLPLAVTGVQEGSGDLPLTDSYVDILTPNVMLSGLKKAENSGETVIRLYEMEGKATKAQVKLNAAFAAKTAVQADLMEQPLPQNSATIDNNILSVDIPAYGMATILIG